jgi:hypothetical protein
VDVNVSVVRSIMTAVDREGGGAIERAMIRLTQVSNGKFTRLELFEPDDVAGALARLDELRTAAPD